MNSALINKYHERKNFLGIYRHASEIAMEGLSVRET